MKKSVIIALLIVVVFFPLVGAANETQNVTSVLPSIINMKSSYAQAETMLIKIVGLQNTISLNDIYFYKGHTRIPILYDFTKINNDIYLYAITPSGSGDYVLKIKNVQYRSGANLITSDIENNFSVSSEAVYFNVYPGAIITTSGFSLRLESFQITPLSIEIKSPFNSSSSVNLNSGDIKIVNFDIPNDLNASLYSVALSGNYLDYSIPVLLTKSTKPIPLQKEMKFSPPIINVSLSLSENKTFIVYLSNTGDLNLSSINLSVSNEISGIVNISEINSSQLEIGESLRIRLFVVPNKEGVFNGKINAVSGSVNALLPISLSISKILNQTNSSQPINQTNDNYEEEKNCNQFNGEPCSQTEYCAGKEELLLNGKCCLGLCQPITQDNPSSITSYIGWGILILVVLALIWFLIRQFKKPAKII